VNQGVVLRAEQPAVLDIRGASVVPGPVVVGAAHPGGPVAPLGGAAAVAQGERDPLGFGVEAAFAAEVEDLGDAVEDGGDDPSRAREPPGFAG